MTTIRVKVNEDQLVADYNSGVGMVDLGDKYGINKLTVRKVLVKHGVTIRGKGRPAGAKNRPKKASVTSEELVRFPTSELPTLPVTDDESLFEGRDFSDLQVEVTVPEPEPITREEVVADNVTSPYELT